MPHSQPNLLFLLNDHQAHYRHGWDAGPKVRRPCFDALAVVMFEFRSAYTSCPLCGPARRTMLTGLLPHAHRETKNDTGHPYDREVYLDTLAERDYRNLYYGKWHAGPGTAHDHACEGFSGPSYNNPYTKPEYADYRRRRGLPEPTILLERMFWPIEGAEPGKPYRQEQKWCNEHATGILDAPKETHEAFFLAHLACERLRERAASGDGRPFALRVDFWGPHPPYFATQEFADLYDPAEIPEYGNFRDELSGKPDVYRAEWNDPLHEDGTLIQPSALPWSEWQRVLALCYAQITLVDAAGGLILDTLDELGLAENTLVVWAADHGDAVACHGGHFDKGSYMPEEMLRVPMAMRWPERIEPGQTCERLVSNMDLAPTFLAAAGGAFTQPVHGRSLLPLARGDGADWREDVLCETHGHFDNHVARALLTDRYKYIANRGQTDELYDLVEDPYELENLAGRREHRGTVTDLRMRLLRWQQRTGDPETVLEPA